MLRKNRTMCSFRLDELTVERLKKLAEELGASQAELLEYLVNACFDSACISYDVKGFERFAERCREIKELQNRKFNATTEAVMEDIKAGKNMRRFKSPEELFAELEED